MSCLKESKNLILIVLFCLILGLWCLSYKKVEQRTKTFNRTLILPKFSCKTILGDSIYSNSLDSESTIAIIFFNTHCDYCLFELDEIEKNLHEFEKCQMLFISFESQDSLLNYMNVHTFNSFPNIHFSSWNRKKIKSTFGDMSIPSIFIFAPNQVLVKQFKGTTKVENIIEVINKLEMSGIE